MKLFRKIRFFFDSLFMGMKGGDVVMSAPAHGDPNALEEITPVTVNSVWSDLLNGEETQRVKELIDRYYRVYLESQNYKIALNNPRDRENGFDAIFDESQRKIVKVEKKLKEHSPIYEEDGLDVVAIQDGSPRGLVESVDIRVNNKNKGDSISVKTNLEESYFKLDRNDFIPKMYIEPYIQKVVLKTISNNKTRIDIYVPFYVRQFFKKDSLFKAEMERIRDGKKSDLFLFDRFSFISYKAWGVDDLRMFDFNNLNFAGIHVFDGNYVVSLDGDNVAFNYDVTEKYKLNEVTEKYEKMAPNETQNGVELDAIMRKIESDEVSN